MPRPHACQPAALAGCPLSPQHWQQHWMWACPTGAFSTSPCRCEYWPHPLPATQAKLTCSVQLAVCLASNGPTTPSVSGTGPCPPSAPCWHPAALHAASSSSEAQCRERRCTCLPGSQGKPGNWTEQSQLLVGWDRGWRRAGSRVEDQTVERCLSEPSRSAVTALTPCFRECSPSCLFV